MQVLTVMDTEVTKIKNALNFYKRTKLLVETCTRTMLIVYKFVYNWPDKSHELADHLDEIPVYQTKSLRLLIRGPGDIDKIEAMMIDEDLMKGYDITFFYKLIQFAINNDKMKPVNNDVWNRKCLVIHKDELEYLLYLTKTERNEFNHKENKFLNLKDDDNELYCDDLVIRLPSIIRQAGTRGNINPAVVKDACDSVLQEIESIRVMKDISSSDEKPILKLMVEKYLLPGLIKLNECFSNELKSYCPPNFQLGNRILSTEQLLSDVNMQVICIRGEAGFGKTSFTKFVQRKLLLKIESARDDLASHEIPIQIACRDIVGRNVTEFLEDEIPILKRFATSFSTLKECLAHFDIRWIIDGYDEKSPGFSGFFQSLLKTLPNNHKIIITLRPNYQKEIEDELNNMRIYDALIKCFNDPQIKDVSEKFLGSDKSRHFVSSIQKLNDEMQHFMKTPINLILCLELWTNDDTIFQGDLKTVYQLHKNIFGKLITLLVDRHKDQTSATNIDDLKNNVSKWFCDLCKIIAESPFSYELNISESQKKQLQEAAFVRHLRGSYCLSMFFICEKSSTGIKYFIKHKTQKEVLVCHYLKKCGHEDLKAIEEQNEIYYLLERKNPFNIFKFLTECCLEREFSTIFEFYFKKYSSLQRPGCLLQIKREKEEYFDAFKTNYSGKLVLNVDKDDDPTDLMNVIQSLSTKVKSFKLIINVGDGTEITFNRNINEVLGKYHNSVKLELSIIVSEETVNIRDILKV